MSCSWEKTLTQFYSPVVVLSPNHCHESPIRASSSADPAPRTGPGADPGPGAQEHHHGKVNTESSPESSGSPGVATSPVTLV